MRRARVLTIAGSDSGGGAGIQADLKTFAAHGVYGTSVVTAVTAQNTVGVHAVHGVPPEVVAAQIDAVLDDIGADAVKIGMLANAEIVRVVADRLRAHRPPHVVLDPVMVAQSGDPLLEEEAVEALIDELLPLAEIVTPNLPEAARLLSKDGIDVEALEALLAGEESAEPSVSRALSALGALCPPGGAILLKGGHASGDRVVDLLVEEDGVTLRLEDSRIETRSNHGTGCTLSSAIAARLALGSERRGRSDGSPRHEAIRGAVDYLRGALAAAEPIGRDPSRGHGPVDHLYRLYPETSTR